MRVVLFGDSHLAAVRNGLNALAVPDGIELEFWGTAGHRFRHISWKEDKIVPDDASTAAAFARFNRNGMTELDPALFDAVVFVGARIRPGPVLPDLLNNLAHPARHLTRDYMRHVLADHFRAYNTYRMARDMAQTGKTRVLMAPVSLETEGKSGRPRRFTVARRATDAHVAILWDLTRQILAEDGITFIPQPLASITKGYYTKAEYGVEGKDSAHKNPEYGALVLREVLSALAGGAL